MTPDSDPRPKRDSDKSVADKKGRSAFSGPNGKPLGKKRQKPSDIQFTHIIEKINEGFVSLDAQMNYIYINQRGSELLMRKPEELIGKNYWEVYPQDKDTSFGRAYLQALETQTPIVLEDVYGPGERWFEKRIYPSESGLSIFFNDITQRKQTEEALYRIDERLLATYQYAPIGIVECSLDGQYINVNDEFCRMLGYEKPELLTRGLKDVTHPEDLASDLSQHQQLIQGEIPSYKIEKRFVRKDGETIWAEVTRSVVHHANGMPLYTIGVMLDITERKHAEQALREKDEQLRRVTDVTPALFSECSRDLRYLFVNRAAAEFLGFPSEEIIGKPIIQIMGEQAFETILPYIERVLNGERVEYEVEIPYRAAGQRFVHVIYVPTRDEIGTVLGWLATVTDITERKRSEERQRQSEEQSRLAIQAARACTWELNLQDQSYELDDHFEELLGFSPDLLPKNRNEVIDVLIVKEDMPAVREAVHQAVQNRSEVPPLQFRVIHPQTKDMIWLEVNAKVAYDAEGKSQRIFGMVRNITGRKAEEELLKRLLQREREQRASAEQAKAEADQARAQAERALAEQKQAEAALGAWADAPLPPDARSPWLKYGMALITTAIAVLGRYILEPLLGNQLQLTPLFGAIAFSVWYAGLGPALLSAIVGYLATSWLFIEPGYVLALNAANLVGLAIYLLSSTVIISLGDTMRRAQRHAHESARLAVERKRQAQLLLVEQKHIEATLRESEQRFRDIFETAGVSVWVQDFTEVKAALDELHVQGIQDFRAYFAEHPDFVRRAIDMVRIVDVNSESLHLFGAQHKEDLLHALSNVFLPETESAFLEELITLAEGRESIRSEAQHRTLDGRMISVLFTIHFGPPTGDLSRVVVTITDITERKHGEAALLEYARQQTALYELSEQLQRTNSEDEIYNAALNAILSAVRCNRAAILLFDQTDKMSFVAWRGLSEKYRQATEGHSPWTRDERDPQPITMSDIDTAELSDSLKTVVKAEGIGALAFIPLISDGKLIGKFMVYFNATHMFGEAEIDLSQTIAHQFASAIERRRAEDGLRTSESLYRTIARSIPGGGVYVIDKDFRYLVAEGPVTEAFGLTRETLEGHTVSEIYPSEAAARMEDRLRQNFSGETVSFETAHLGRFYWTQQAPLLDSIGHAIVVTLDITERKQMEQALRQSEERFAGFMQNLPGLAWIKDMQGRYVYANAAAEKAFQTPREKLYGKTDAEVFSREVAAQYKKNDERALQERQGIQVIEDLEQEDGILHYSLVTKFPIPGADGEFALIGGTAFDITERKQAEEALKQARARAEETADRMARLHQVTASLARAATPAQLAEEILEQGTRATGAVASLLTELVNNGLELKTIAALGYPPAAVRTEPVPLLAPTPMSDCIRTKQAIWLGSHEEFAAHYPALAETRQGFGNEATVALPLTVGARVLGGLAFSFREKREFLAEERGFFLAVAQQCAQGLERVLASEALRESEERYRALVNQATAGIVRKDPNGKILFVNEAFCDMLGYQANELLGKTMWQFTHEDDVSENRRLYSRLMADGIPFELEKRLLRRDGSILWTAVSVSPVAASSGKPQSAVSVYVDITDRKQAEIDLNESRERFRNLFNLVPVAVYSCDADGLIQEYNRSAIELWGREPIRNDPSERYCGSLKIYYPDGRFMPHRSCPMARMLRGETLNPTELEILVERSDGSRRDVIAHPLPLRNERGKIIGAINCLYDITDRKQAEGRLALLAEVSEVTRKFEDPIELMAAVSDTVGKHFHARRCLFNEIHLDEDLEVVHYDYHDSVESVVGMHKLSDYSSTTTAEIMSGKTIVNHDSKADPRTANDYVSSYLPTNERAYIAVPLLRDNRWGATLWVSDDMPRQWSQAEVSLLEAVAERTWTAAEKLRIHAELRDSEERLRVTFNTTAVGFATLRPDLRFVEVNDAYCAITGYSRQELTQMDGYSLTHPAYKEETKKQVARLVTREIPSFTMEKIYIRRDGTEIWVQNSVSVVRDADGDPRHLIIICQEVTERKRAEEALQLLNMELEQRVLLRTAELSATNEHLLEEIEERAMVEEALRESDATTRLILDTSPDAIVIANRDGRIMRVNAQIADLFGYQPDEVLRRPIEILIPERFHQRHMKHRFNYNQRPHRRPMGIELELFGRRKDGSEFAVDVTLTPIQTQNIADWDTMVTIRDSTERKRMEAELRESHKRLQMLSQRLVEVQEDERRSIARELHDRVGQSLAALSLNLAIIHNELSSVADEQVNPRLTDSRQLVTEVIALVRDVMADLRPAVLDDYGLEAALNTTLEKFQTRFGIDIRFEKNQLLIPRLGPSIEMTILRIAQEAIVNAGRHAQADFINLSLQLEDSLIRLTVQDNGIGIQSWEQVNRPGSHGLTIIRERAEAVGGTLKVSSTLGQGTKIEVTIPVQYRDPKE